MSFEQLLLLAKEISPWLSGLIVIAWFGTRILAFLKSEREPLALEEVRDELRALRLERQQDMRFDQESVATLRNIEAQLMIANSRSTSDTAVPDHMGSHNQKRMIENIIAWCRAGSFAALKNSIRNNNIKGREDVVTQKLYRAFRSCSTEALESLNRFDGITYNYGRFFDEMLPVVWRRIIHAAIPLYHRHLSKGIDLDEAIEDFEIRVKSWFDEELEKFFNKAEDPETGVIYRNDNRVSGEFDEWLGIAHELRDYSKTDTTGYLPQQEN